MNGVTDQQWEQFQAEGWFKLDDPLSDNDLKALQDEIDAIMLGGAELDYDQLDMQLDSTTGTYSDIERLSKGHKGATLNYRKIERLEYDPVFLEYATRPVFKDF